MAVDSVAAHHLGGPGPSPYYVQYPIHRCAVRGEGCPVGQPVANRQAYQVVGQVGHRSDIGDVYLGHQAGQQCDRLGGPFGVSGK